MSLKTKVKVGNITNLSDARYCAGMGVDWLGFPIESVNTKTFAEITSWVTGPQFMIELKAGAVPESLYEYGVELIQVDSDWLSEVQAFKDFELIITISLANWSKVKDQLKTTKAKVRYVVVNDLSGDYELDMYTLKEIAAVVDVLLDLESSSYTLDQILEFPIAGLNLTGNAEMKPGLNDNSQLSEILEKLEVE
jgi:phosphoribosylanthranilate isomerase